MTVQTEPCPLCAANAAKDAQHQRLALAGLGIVDVTFGHCDACGHIYQVRQAPEEILDRHYAQFSNYTCFDVDAARNAAPSALTRRLLALAEAHTPNKGLAYEVGCATGPHLTHFRKAGWTVGGCDPSAKACDQAKQIHGIDIDCGMETEALPQRKNLDLILFSHVLEHLKDPRSALMRAHKALSDEGTLLLEVPCATAPHLLPPGWFSFEHLHYFSESALLQLLHATGFAPIEVRIAFEAYIYPVIAVIARKTKPRTRANDGGVAVTQARNFLAAFAARDDKLWHNSARRVRHLDGPVYVWGAGVHTAQLFDRTSLLRDAQIKAIVDRDSQKWGLKQAGRDIVNPEIFFNDRSRAPVVISSYAAEAEIAKTLQDSGIANDRIVRLYT
jgi:SAM-dependent methyltransferase